MASFGAVSATLPDIDVTGTAQNFEILGNGTFVTLPNFGIAVILGPSSPLSDISLGPVHISITEIGLNWPNIQTDPTNFILTVSASVEAIQGIDGLSFSGAIDGLQIDIGKLKQGQFPVVGLESIGV